MEINTSIEIFTKNVKKFKNDVDDGDVNINDVEKNLQQITKYLVINNIWNNDEGKKSDIRSKHEELHHQLHQLQHNILHRFKLTNFSDSKVGTLYTGLFSSDGMSPLIDIYIRAKNTGVEDAGRILAEMDDFRKKHYKFVDELLIKEFIDERTRVAELAAKNPVKIQMESMKREMRSYELNRAINLDEYVYEKIDTLERNEKVFLVLGPDKLPGITKIRIPNIKNKIMHRIFMEFMAHRIRMYGTGVDNGEAIYEGAKYPFQKMEVEESNIKNRDKNWQQTFDGRKFNAISLFLDSLTIGANISINKGTVTNTETGKHITGYKIDKQYFKSILGEIFTPLDILSYAESLWKVTIDNFNIDFNIDESKFDQTIRVGIRIIFIGKQDPMDKRFDNYLILPYDSYLKKHIVMRKNELIILDSDETWDVDENGRNVKMVELFKYKFSYPMKVGYTLKDVAEILVNNQIVPHIDSTCRYAVLLSSVYEMQIVEHYDPKMHSYAVDKTFVERDDYVKCSSFNEKQIDIVYEEGNCDKKLTCGPTAIVLTYTFGKHGVIKNKVSSYELLEIFGEHFKSVIYEKMSLHSVKDICKHLNMGCYIVDRNFECLICEQGTGELYPLVAGYAEDHLYPVLNNNKRKHIISLCRCTFGQGGPKFITNMSSSCNKNRKIIRHIEWLDELFSVIYHNQDSEIDITTPIDLQIIYNKSEFTTCISFNNCITSENYGKINEVKIGNIRIRNKFKYSDGVEKICELFGISEESTVPSAMMKAYDAFCKSTKNKIRHRSILTDEDREILIPRVQTARVFYDHEKYGNMPYSGNLTDEDREILISRVQTARVFYDHEKYGNMPYSGTLAACDDKCYETQICVDENKSHTAILLSYTEVPVFGRTSQYVYKCFSNEYDMKRDEFGIISDGKFKCGVYHVIYCDNKILGAKFHCGFVIDEFIKLGTKFKVDCYKIGNRTTTLNYEVGDFIKYAINILGGPDNAKGPINMFAGCNAKETIETTKFYKVYSKSESELIKARGDYVINIPEINGDHDLSVVSRTYRLVDTNKLLHMAMIDMAIVRLNRRINDILECGHEIIIRDPINFNEVGKEIIKDSINDKIKLCGVSTDSIIFDTTERMCKNIKRYCELNNHSIGGTKIANVNIPVRCRQLYINDFPISERKDIIVNIDNRVELDKMATILDGKSCMLAGGAGNGKTTAINRFISTTKLKYVVCTPTNKACTHIKDSVTIHRFFNSRGFELPKYLDIKTKKEVDNLDIVIVDECSMITPIMVNCLHMVKKYKPCIQFVLSYDPDQLQCVKSENDITTMYDFRSLGDFRIIKLNYNYRQETDPKFVETLNKIRNKDFSFIDIDYGDKLTLRNLAFQNKTCNRVNTEIFDRVFKNVVTTGVRLVSCGNFDLSKFGYVNYKYLMAKNSDYTVKSTQHQYVCGHYIELVGLCLIDQHGYEININCKVYNDSTYSSKKDTKVIEMSFGFCTTIHKSQGSTYKDTVTIHDTGMMRLRCENVTRLLYTAITRVSGNDVMKMITFK